MAFYFWCEGCKCRFPLEPEDHETDEQFIERAAVTKQEPCPLCYQICGPCKCNHIND